MALINYSRFPCHEYHRYLREFAMELFYCHATVEITNIVNMTH